MRTFAFAMLHADNLGTLNVAFNYKQCEHLFLLVLQCVGSIDLLDGYNRTWSVLGLVPGFSIIHPES